MYATVLLYTRKKHKTPDFWLHNGVFEEFLKNNAKNNATPSFCIRAPRVLYTRKKHKTPDFWLYKGTFKGYYL